MILSNFLIQIVPAIDEHAHTSKAINKQVNKSSVIIAWLHLLHELINGGVEMRDEENHQNDYHGKESILCIYLHKPISDELVFFHALAVAEQVDCAHPELDLEIHIASNVGKQVQLHYRMGAPQKTIIAAQ